MVGASPGGGWQGWLRAKQWKMIAEGIMGSTAGTPTAVATPTKVLPYYTMPDVIPGVQCTRTTTYGLARYGGERGAAGRAVQLEAVALAAVLGARSRLGTAHRHQVQPLVREGDPGRCGRARTSCTTTNRNVTLLRGDMGLATTATGLFEVTGTVEDLRHRRRLPEDPRRRRAATVLTRTVSTEALQILYEEDATHSVASGPDGHRVHRNDSAGERGRPAHLADAHVEYEAAGVGEQHDHHQAPVVDEQDAESARRARDELDSLRTVEAPIREPCGHGRGTHRTPSSELMH